MSHKGINNIVTMYGSALIKYLIEGDLFETEILGNFSSSKEVIELLEHKRVKFICALTEKK